MVSIAALALTIVGSAFTIYYARRNTKAAEDSAKVAGISAKASEKSAEAARINAKASADLMAIERDREYDRMRPKLRGCLAPETAKITIDDRPGPDTWLEVHLDASTPQPLRALLLTVPGGAMFARGCKPGESTLSANDFGFPGEGGHRPPIRPGRPARWRVYRSDSARGTLRATARCTREDGVVWEDVEVLISQDIEDV